MMIVFIIYFAGPFPEVLHEGLPDLDILVVDEGGEVVDVVAGLVKIFYWDGVRVSESYEVLEDEGVVLPEAAPEDGSKGVESGYPYFRFF